MGSLYERPEDENKSGWLFKLGLHRKDLRAWALYDWANSVYATTIMAAVLPIYYADVAAATLPEHMRTATWGYAAGIALFISALCAPVLGAAADYLGAKKKFLSAFLIIGVISSVSLALVHKGDWLLAVVLLITGEIGFAGGNVFYESLLPHIAKKEEVDKVSTAGYAIGYIGGGILLAINLAWISMPATFGFETTGEAVRFSFISVGVWWAFFSIPLFRHISEPPRHLSYGEHSGQNAIVISISRLWRTFKKIRQYKQLLIFLIAFWLYSDGIGTIIKMAAIYGREIGIGSSDLIGALLLVQFLGIPCTFLFGAVANKFSAKTGIVICLVIYSTISIGGYFMHTALHFWLLAAGVATVQGGCQGLSRSVFTKMIPQKQSSEFFGFFSVSSKFAGVFGPLAFGMFSQLLGGSRFSILFLVTFFVAGLILLLFVDIEKGTAIAEREDTTFGLK